MGKVVVINQVTLDGVMQGPGRPDEDTRSEFAHGGWAFPRGDHAIVAKTGERMGSGDLTVAGDRVMMRPVQPDDLGQQMRIALIRLRSRGGVSFPIPGHLQRVDRKHHIAGSQQRLHPRPALGLNAHLHLIRLGCRI
jgi:hypothetical protein